MSRRKRRRRRDREAKAVAPVPNDERPVNWSRLRQVFGNMSHRGTRLFPHHVLAPVVVDAFSPEEMVEATERGLIEQAKKQQPS
jgi:hypothetical protein